MMGMVYRLRKTKNKYMMLGPDVGTFVLIVQTLFAAFTWSSLAMSSASEPDAL